MLRKFDAARLSYSCSDSGSRATQQFRLLPTPRHDELVPPGLQQRTAATAPAAAPLPVPPGTDLSEAAEGTWASSPAARMTREDSVPLESESSAEPSTRTSNKTTSPPPNTGPLGADRGIALPFDAMTRFATYTTPILLSASTIRPAPGGHFRPPQLGHRIGQLRLSFRHLADADVGPGEIDHVAHLRFRSRAPVPAVRCRTRPAPARVPSPRRRPRCRTRLATRRTTRRSPRPAERQACCCRRRATSGA